MHNLAFQEQKNAFKNIASKPSYSKMSVIFSFQKASVSDVDCTIFLFEYWLQVASISDVKNTRVSYLGILLCDVNEQACETTLRSSAATVTI